MQNNEHSPNADTQKKHKQMQENKDSDQEDQNNVTRSFHQKSHDVFSQLDNINNNSNSTTAFTLNQTLTVQKPWSFAPKVPNNSSTNSRRSTRSNNNSRSHPTIEQISDKYTKQLLERVRRETEEEEEAAEAAEAEEQVQKSSRIKKWDKKQVGFERKTNDDDEDEDGNQKQKNKNSNLAKKVVICVKRRRDDDPLEEFYMEQAPKRQKRTIVMNDTLDEELSSRMSAQTALKDFPLKRFSFIDSANDYNLSVARQKIEKTKNRNQLKNVDLKSSAREKRAQKFKQNVREIRLLKINEKRSIDGDTRLIQVDLHVEDEESDRKEIKEQQKKQNEQRDQQDFMEMQQYASLLKQTMSAEEYNYLMKNDESEHSDFVYDYYYMNDEEEEDGAMKDESTSASSSASSKQKNIVKIERYDQDTIWYDTEYATEEDLLDYDSEDSNDEANPNNDYPDEGEDFGFGDQFDPNYMDEDEYLQQQEEQFWVQERNQSEFDIDPRVYDNSDLFEEKDHEKYETLKAKYDTHLYGFSKVSAEEYHQDMPKKQFYNDDEYNDEDDYDYGGEYLDENEEYSDQDMDYE